MAALATLPWAPTLAAAVGGAWLLLLAAWRAYEPAPTAVEPRRLWCAGGCLAVIMAFGAPLLGASSDARPLVAVTVLIVLATLLNHRTAAAWARRTAPGVRLVVAGAAIDVRRALGDLDAAGGVGCEVVGTCGDAEDAIARAVDLHRPDAVVVLPGAGLDPATLRRVGWTLQASGTELFVGTGLPDVAPARTRDLRLGGLGVRHVRAPEVTGVRARLKSAGERVAAGLGLLLLAPVLAVLCLAVRLDSPGPALFRQRRVGQHGRPFTMIKLRTMTTAAEEQLVDLADGNECDGVLFKMRQDPRITRFGRWLRKFSLDELPQLVNVVRGEMSLVGPRPALESEVAGYCDDVRRRLVVRPGMTGLWQVSGRSDLSWEESVRLDLAYVDNWSWGLDLTILARTLHAVVSHRGAY